MWSGRHLGIRDVMAVPRAVRTMWPAKDFTVYQTKPGCVVALTGKDSEPYEMHATHEVSYPVIESLLASKAACLGRTADGPVMVRDVWSVDTQRPVAMDYAYGGGFPFTARVVRYWDRDVERGDFGKPVDDTVRTLTFDWQ